MSLFDEKFIYFNVVAGKYPFHYVQGLTEALIPLMAPYVFDLEWCKYVMEVLLFIEFERLERTTEQLKSSNAVNIFKNLLHTILIYISSKCINTR